jgi:hypothetical protein
VLIIYFFPLFFKDIEKFCEYDSYGKIMRQKRYFVSCRRQTYVSKIQGKGKNVMSKYRHLPKNTEESVNG